ncbi:MAG: glutamine-hydrolyzing carbamoyl-phosphate synthase small subunit [Deltaproteobacteria bacterium]|nr:glutamine-hydrolyzing carbamoyl-phosphate synthase small subunit [Deltaproteobacteria bacterium]
MKTKKPAILALADGTVFEGYSFGSEGETIGEVVFNTSMTGYQEVLTDPSYRGQIVAMTYTEQGNYGVNPEDVESWRPWVEGFIVKDPCEYPSNWRHLKGGVSLDEYLKKNSIVGISGIDTRALTRRIREKGAMEGVISTVDLNPVSLVDKAEKSPGLVGRDLVKEVTCKEPYKWDEGLWTLEGGYGRIPVIAREAKQSRGGEGSQIPSPSPLGERAGVRGKRFKVVAYDFGIKRNILRNLVSSGCDVTVVPATTTAEDVLKMNPDGVFLSNGPGDPEPVRYAQESIKKLMGKKPVFGICLGHQLMGLALGGKTFKMKFGHRGANQPVKDLKTGRVEITCQNHGFAVDMDSVKKAAELTHVNLNDLTVEGLCHREGRFFSVQYHPEASPGPHDAAYLFKRFVEMMGKG